MTALRIGEYRLGLSAQWPPVDLSIGVYTSNNLYMFIYANCIIVDHRESMLII